MAKQTFTTGQVLTAAQMTSLQATALGGGAASTKTASYVLVAADAGTTVAMNAAGATTITVNTGLFAAGDTVFIQNVGAGVCTITAGTATVNTAGALALPQYDAGILYFTSASAAIFYDYIQVGAASPLTTKGDLYTFSTSDTRLGVGANNTVLTADSAEATGLKWAAPAGGGKVLQVLSDTTQTRVANATTSFVDTGLEITITPTSATSKILIMITADSYKTDGNVNNAIIWRLFRGGTRIQGTQDALYTGTALIQNSTWSCIYLDSPATTSATVYKLQFANINASATVAIVPNNNDAQGNMTLMEIGA